MLSNKEQELLEKMFEYAEKNRVTFFPIQNVIDKVRKMSSNGNKCICDPDNRVCPCEESVVELQTNGFCKCWLFSTYKNGNEYLDRHAYIVNGKITTDKERKQIVAERDRAKRMLEPKDEPFNKKK